MLGSATITLKPFTCTLPEDVLWNWEQFKAHVTDLGNTPVTTNRDCQRGHYARFALFRDPILGRNRLLVTRPLTYETRGTAEDFREIIAPTGPYSFCANNEIVVSGWVSYADWEPLLDGAPISNPNKFLFTSRNYSDDFAFGKLGRVEEGTEYMPLAHRDALAAFFSNDVSDKIFPCLVAGHTAPTTPSRPVSSQHRAMRV